jgi:hypothetical protein
MVTAPDERKPRPAWADSLSYGCRKPRPGIADAARTPYHAFVSSNLVHQFWSSELQITIIKLVPRSCTTEFQETARRINSKLV